MWGNLQGWLIATLLGALLGLGLYQLASANRVTLPTPEGENPLQLNPITLEITPNTVIQMTQPGDAGELFRQAIEDVRKNREEYKQSLDSTSSIRRISKLKSIQLLQDAIPLAGMSLLSTDPQSNVGYFPNNTSQDITDIEQAGLVVEKLGVLQFHAKNYDDSKRQFYAEFSLGSKLFSERISFKEAEKGLGFMRASVQMLVKIAEIEKNENRFKELNEFNEQLGVIYEQMRSLWMIIYSVDDKVVSANVGNLFLYASEKMQERMWRAEAILKVGRFKYNVGGANARLTDQRAAQMLLDQLDQTETDPILKAAIHAAKNLTLEQFRAIQ